MNYNYGYRNESVPRLFGSEDIDQLEKVPDHSSASIRLHNHNLGK